MLSETETVKTLLEQRSALSALVWIVVRDHHAAEDIFQEVTVKALEHRATFPDRARLVAWSKVTAKNRAIDHIRKRERSPVTLDTMTLDSLWADASVDDQCDHIIRRSEALRSCLDRLPEKSRVFIKLRYGMGLGGKAISERVGKSLDAVYQILSRIHRRLRVCIEHDLATRP